MTVTNLLLGIAAFIFSWMLVVWFHGNPRVSYNFERVANETRDLSTYLQTVEEAHDQELSEETVNAWLAGFPVEHPINDGVLVPGYDNWGNPYRCVMTHGLSDDSASPFGIYSTGEDGTSQTSGNDPDDINSWDHQSLRWYHAAVNRASLIAIFGQALLLTPLAFCLLLAGHLFVRWCKVLPE